MTQNLVRDEAIRLPMRFSAGTVGARFLTALRDEQRILASLCPQCSLVVCPARSVCPTCCAGIDSEVIPVGPGGRLESWTHLPERGTFGLVRLDGAGTSMLHRLLGPPESWTTGMRVTARFAPERHGSILDIEGFTPEGGEA